MDTEQNSNTPEAQTKAFQALMNGVKTLDCDEIIKQAEAALAIEDEKMRGKIGHTRAMSPSGSFVRSPGGSFQLAKPVTLLGQYLKALLFFLKNRKLPMMPQSSTSLSPYASLPIYKEIAELLVAKGQWPKETLDLFKS
jgi:hypothetical protein